MFRAVLVFIAVAAFAAPASAETFAVTTTEDRADGACDADCSLREAVVAANATPEVDTIDLPAGVYELIVANAEGAPEEDAAATGDLDLLADLTILGAGGEETIVRAANQDRVLHVLGAATHVALSDLSVERGGRPPEAVSGGEGIKNAGVLTLARVNVRDCAGPGVSVAAGASLAMSGGSLAGNAEGGVLNFFSMDLAEVLVENNGICGVLNNLGLGAAARVRRSTIRANLGCGISNGGAIAIADSTISQNHSTTSGGGIANLFGAVTATNTTFSGNAADQDGGGLLNFGGTVSLNQCTFAANTAGGAGRAIFSTGGVAARATVVDNASGGCSGGVASDGWNIERGDTCGFHAVSDLPGVNPKLGPLADGGGPTETHAPLAGSPAVDSVRDYDCPCADQRGEARPADGDGDLFGWCDAGAVEAPGKVVRAPEELLGAVVHDEAPESSVGEVVDLLVQDSNGELPDPSARPHVTLYSNPEDNGFARTTAADGAERRYHGAKTGGLPSDLELAVIEAPDLDPARRIRWRFDGMGRPFEGLRGDGAFLTLAWTAATRFTLEVSPASRGAIFKKSYVITALPTAPPAKAGPKAARVGAVTATLCGQQPVTDADVFGDFGPEGAEPEPLGFIHVGDGRFEYSLPSAPAPERCRNEICAAAESAIRSACGVPDQIAERGWQGICDQARASVKNDPELAAEMGEACEALGFATLDLCSAPREPGAPALRCDAVERFVDTYSSDPLVVTADVSHFAYDGGEALEFAVPPAAPAPEETVVFTAPPAILSLVTEPANPAAFEEYEIVATVLCPFPGVQVSLAFDGTDDRMGSVVRTLLPGQAEARLQVEGGSGGVKDTITAQVLPDGPIVEIKITF